MIEIHHLTIQFKANERPLINKMSLSIHQGDKILLIGPSGSGKSVLLKTIMGVVPENWVKSGTFHINDQILNYQDYQRHMIHERFSTIFQDAINSLHPYRTIANQFHFAKQEAIQKSCQTLRLQYNHIKNAFSRQLSGGQCQRVSIMFPNLLWERDIVIFDEPITDIDPISHKTILQLIKNSFLLKPDKTVLYVTHRHNEIEDISFKRVELGHTPLSSNKTLNDMPLMRVNIPLFQYPSTDNRNFAIQKVKFDIDAGDSIGILGESGSGKSTLLKILAGLVPLNKNCELSMNVCQQLIPLHHIKRKELYASLQIVFQDNVGSLYENETVYQSFKHISRIKRVSIDDVCLHARTFCETIGLLITENDIQQKENQHRDTFDNFLQKKVNELSMGMVRRYCLIKAVLLMNIYSITDRNSNKLLLLDEISRGLDFQIKQSVIKFIQTLQKEYGISVVAISHEKDFLLSFCHKFYFMFEGFQIPKAYAQMDLTPEGVNHIKNTYLRRFFLPCVEPEPYARETDRPKTGCIFQQFYQCPEHCSECSKQRKEYPWICV